MPRWGYLLVAKASHAFAAGVAGCFFEAMQILTPELAEHVIRDACQGNVDEATRETIHFVPMGISLW
jgi:hypothetical protein